MEQLFQQLRHSDPSVRRATIIEIGKRGDPRALKALKYVHQNDPDPQLRELAYKAGAHIAKQQKAKQSAPPPPQPPPRDPEAEANQGFKWYGDLFDEEAEKKPSEEPQRVEVSRQDEDRAKVLLSRAMDYYMREDRPKAADNLAKALNLNPNLRKDPMANGLAQDITDLVGQFAFDAILQKDTRKHMFMADRQRKTQQKFAETADDIMTVFTYLLAYLIFVTVGYLTYFILTLKISTDTWSDIYGYDSVTYEIGYPTLFVYSAFYAIVNTIFLVLLGGAVHMVARWMFIGSGSALGFMKRQIPFVASAMMVFFGLMFMFSLAPDTFMLVTFGIVFGTLVFLYMFAGLVARYYNLGTVGGCLATIVGLALFVALNFLGLYLLASSVE